MKSKDAFQIFSAFASLILQIKDSRIPSDGGASEISLKKIIEEVGLDK